MKRVTPESSWPKSWKESYHYDLLEIYGEKTNPGYSSSYAVRKSITLELIKKSFEPGARIVDVAAAQGNFTLTCAELGYEMTWNDLRAELADYVRLKHENGSIDYQPGNVLELGLEEQFDGVIITEIIEHVAHPDQFLVSIGKLLKPGGRVVMTTPNGAYFLNRLPRFFDCPDPSIYESQQFKPNSDGHIFLLYPDEIIELSKRAGFKIENLIHFLTPLTSGHLKLWHLLKFLPPKLVLILERLSSKLPLYLKQKICAQTACVLIKVTDQIHPL
ncbi:hypothetical protein BH11VER1_BH11VER1_10770 [soil metagenome]